MSFSGSYLLQYTSDPFEGKWEDLVVFKWDGRKWDLNFLRNLPVNQQLERWCRDGVLQITEAGEDEKIHLLSPSAREFLPTIAERLGKLKYRFVEKR